MKNVIRSLIYFLLIFAFNPLQTALSQNNFWEPVPTSYNSRINYLTQDSLGNIYTALYEGSIFRSSDNGRKWTQLNNGLPGSLVVTCIDFDKNGYIYAGTWAGGILRSSDYGKNWIQMIKNGVGSPKCLGVNSNGDIYAGSDAGLFRSTDKGVSWREIKIAGTDISINAILLLSDSTIVVGGSSRGIYKSTDYGNTWRSISTPLLTVHSIIADNHGVLYAASNGADGTVCKSTDQGENWSIIFEGKTMSWIQSLFVDSQGNIFIGTQQKIIYSTDNGSTWQNSIINGNFMNTYCLLGTSGGSIFVGTETGIFKSDNLCKTWAQVFSGVKSQFSPLTTDNKGAIFLGTNSGAIIRSTNKGINWEYINICDTSARVYSILTGLSNQLFVTINNRGIYRSTDNCETWAQINNGIDDLNYLSLAQNRKGYLFAALQNRGVSRSTDNGNSWTRNDSVWAGIGADLILVDHLDNIYAGTRRGMYLSTDDGNGWFEINSGFISSPGQIFSLACNSNNDVFLANKYGIYYTSDHGSSWNQLPTQRFFASNVQAMAVNDIDRIFIGTLSDGIFQSTNRGLDWTSIQSGIQIYYGVTAFALDPDGIMYANADQIYRSTKSTTSVENESLLKPTEFDLSPVFPNPFNTETQIQFIITETTHARIDVYSALGQRVRTLLNDNLSKGKYALIWDGSWEDGLNASSGLYFVRLEAQGKSEIRKLMRMK